MFLVFAATTVACSDPGVECTCADPTITVTVPADRAAYVIDVQLSGAACANAKVVCQQPVGSGCAEMTFRGTTIGSCTVDVELGEGPADYTTTFEVVRYPCCPGYYAELATGSSIQVPDVPGDAGASE
jgi:hypothetical protein